MPLLLAQGDDAAGGMVSVIGWGLVLLALVVAAFVAILWLKRWLKSDMTSVSTGFGLSDLREMHRRGQLTDEEYERARGKIAAASKAVTSQMPSPAGGRRAPGAAGPAAASGPGPIPPPPPHGSVRPPPPQR